MARNAPLNWCRQFSEACCRRSERISITVICDSAATLALRTNAPLYAVDIWFEPERVAASIKRIEVPGPEEGPLDARVRVVTQRLADAYQEAIARHPQDWHMLQKLWL